MDSSVNPQPTDGHIRISHEIHRELIRRKFTQRQKNIIDFVLTLSWGCKKPSAIIPQLKQFEQCGIRKNHIRQELGVLVEKKVLLWDETLCVFQINKHYDQWIVDLVESFDIKTMNELIRINLENESPNLSKSVPKKGTEFPKREPKTGSQKGDKVPKKGTEFPKRELSGSQKGNSTVPKKGTVIREYPSHIKKFQLSKTIIKAIIKKRTTTTTPGASSKKDYSFGNVFKAYEKNFIAGGKLTEFDIEEFSALFDDYGGEWLLQAMREAYRQGTEKRNLAYVHGVLKGYRGRGGPLKQSRDSPRHGRTARQQQFDELDKLIEEEMEREAQ
ncbi:replication protein [Paenibacillus sp. GCM10012307]|uniref:Replication protein n=1 Tax=Paenibacillus roseus TaxID=2798579 RepID=A0A934MU89_9BACL|nr:replication protein [Paenibacillus roseus]MBJ6360837.1 replication protein [Paenibacillus roseus]